MLREPQAGYLVRHCAPLLGEKASLVKKRLANATHRADVVWELIVLDAFARLADARYEPDADGCPDVLVLEENGSTFWVEVALMHPRFEKEESRANRVREWINNRATQLGISPSSLNIFIGGQKVAAGVVHNLPQEHEKKSLLSHRKIVELFNDVLAHPDRKHAIEIPENHIEIEYSPGKPSGYISGGSTVQEVPSVVEEHAVFRKLKQKAKQYSGDAPYLVWVAGQDNHAISSVEWPTVVPMRRVVGEAFRQNRKISAALITSFETEATMTEGLKRVQRTSLYINPSAKTPLSVSQVALIQKLDLSSWVFWGALDRKDQIPRDYFRMLGPISAGHSRGDTLKLKVGVEVVLRCLGSSNSIDSFIVEPFFAKYLENGYRITGCEFLRGDPRRAVPDCLEFSLEIDPDRVYWPVGKKE